MVVEQAADGASLPSSTTISSRSTSRARALRTASRNHSGRGRQTGMTMLTPARATLRASPRAPDPEFAHVGDQHVGRMRPRSSGRPGEVTTQASRGACASSPGSTRRVKSGPKSGETKRTGWACRSTTTVASSGTWSRKAYSGWNSRPRERSSLRRTDQRRTRGDGSGAPPGGVDGVGGEHHPGEGEDQRRRPHRDAEPVPGAGSRERDGERAQRGQREREAGPPGVGLDEEHHGDGGDRQQGDAAPPDEDDDGRSEERESQPRPQRAEAAEPLLVVVGAAGPEVEIGRPTERDGDGPGRVRARRSAP